MSNVSAIVISSHGDPATVAKLDKLPFAEPTADEARVRVLLAPINPADINVLEGKYPVLPELPGVPGVEGVGVVEEDCGDLKKGTRVLLPHRFGSWRESGNAKAADLVPVPQDIPLEQAAMLRINPATALCMLREFVDLEPGAWVFQNGANSAVGRSVIRMCRHFGWKSLNIVRREELLAELGNEGADAVLLDSTEIPRLGAKLALNTVGGDSATQLAGALADGGTIVTYGAMARRPLKIPNGQLIFNDITWRGFWITRWYQTASVEGRAAILEELFGLVRAGVIATPVEAIYSLTEISHALEHAQKSGRGGKVLLRCSD